MADYEGVDVCECTDEIWIPVEGHVGYDVSSCGRVRSWRSPGKTPGLASAPRLLTGTPACKDGVYLLYSLQEPRRRRYGHTLAAEAFIGPRPEGLVIAHGDGDGHNNHSWNLRYATQVDNAGDMRAHGTVLQGMASWITTLTDDEVIAIREAYAAGEQQKSLALRFETTQQVVSRIVRGLTWSHVGGPRTVRWSKRAS